MKYISIYVEDQMILKISNYVYWLESMIWNSSANYIYDIW